MDLANELVAFGVGVYDSVKAQAYFRHQEFLIELSRSCRLWLLRPPQTRLTYPFCVRWLVHDMFVTEAKFGKRADWFLWMDDDVLPPIDGYARLRDAADPETRPHVAALAYSRTDPYMPSAMVEDETGEHYWLDRPQSGTHPVSHVGMSLCLVHRSVFDIVPEPWFDVGVPVRGNAGYGPDVSFSRKLKECGIQPHICLDCECGHLADGVVIDTATVRMLSK